MSINDIIVTEFGTRSKEYILKRSGATARQESKRKKQKKNKTKINTTEDYIPKEDKKQDTKVAMNGPNFLTLLDEKNIKRVDIKTMDAKLLGVSYNELEASIRFERLNENSGTPFWHAQFYHERLNMSVSLQDIDFCFDTTQVK